MLNFSHCIRDETFLSNSMGFNEHAKHRNCWKCGQKIVEFGAVWWRCAWSYDLPGLCPGRLSTRTHTNWQNYAKIYHFSVLAINHLSQIVRVHTCMSSPHILDTFVWQLASMLKCNYGSFFPNNILFARSLSGIFSVHLHSSNKFYFGTHTARSFIKNPLRSFVYTQQQLQFYVHTHGWKVVILF